MLFKKDNAARSYVDLVYSGTAKMGNWDPAKKIKVGDFGKVSKETGEFVWEGNILEAEFSSKYNLGTDSDRYKPVLAPSETNYFYTSKEARHIRISAGASVPGVTATALGEWEFGKGRGALLAMSRPRRLALPRDFPFKELIDIRELKNKVIVVELYICPSYVLYLSLKGQEAVTFAISGEVANANGNLVTSWKIERASGVTRTGTAPEEDAFTPIYSLRLNEPRPWRKLRGADDVSQPLVGDEILDDAPLPWDALDSDGEEEKYDP